LKKIKDMLLGISILLLVIIIHLFITNGLLTDFLAVIGIVIILTAYFAKDE